MDAPAARSDGRRPGRGAWNTAAGAIAELEALAVLLGRAQRAGRRRGAR
jgi:hypothetical protein